MNTKASLSTFLFVLMVIVVCFITFYAFAKHQKIVNDQMTEIGSVIRAGFQEDIVYLQMKVFSEEAIFYAYNKSISDYVYRLQSGDSYYNVFDYSKLSEGNMAREVSYNTKFQSLVKDRFDLLIENYPQYTSSDKAVYLALKNSEFNFDGENILIKTDIRVFKEGGRGVKISYTKDVYYNPSLSSLGLVDFREVSKIIKSCPYSLELSERKECILNKLSGFEFDKDFSEFKKVETAKGEFYLTKLVSKKEYFVGRSGNEQSSIVRPEIFILLPINSDDETKIMSIFGSTGGESVASNRINLISPEQIPR